MTEFFKTCKLFDKLSDSEKELLEKTCVEYKLKKGAALFKENDVGDSVYFVSSGMIKISKKISGENPTVLGIMKEGDIFGEMAIFDLVPRYADAIAVNESAVYSMKKSDFVALRIKNPKAVLAVMDIIMESLAKRLRKITDRMYGIY